MTITILLPSYLEVALQSLVVIQQANCTFVLRVDILLAAEFEQRHDASSSKVMFVIQVQVWRELLSVACIRSLAAFCLPSSC